MLMRVCVDVEVEGSQCDGGKSKRKRFDGIRRRKGVGPEIDALNIATAQVD